MRTILAYSSWWVVMVGFFAAAAAAAGDGTPSPGLVMGITIANTFFLAAAEQLLPRIRGVSLLRDRQSLNDMGHGVLFSFAGRPLAGGVGLAAVAWIGRSWDFAVASPWPRAAPLVAQVALGLLLWSFLGYWLHRAFHSFDFLWWFHAVHHDTRQMHLLKSGRIHVGEEMLKYLLIPTPFLLLGVPADVLVWMGLWLIFEGNLAHSNLDQRFPSFAHYLLPTVHLHYVHHAERRELQDSNYGGVTPLWDLLFGTYKHPDRHPVERVGLAGDPVPAGFLAQVLYPFKALRDVQSAAARYDCETTNR